MARHSLPLAGGQPAVPVNQDGALRASLGPDAVIIDAMDTGLSSGWTGDDAEFAASTQHVYQGSGSAVTDTFGSALDISATEGSGLNAYFPKGRAMAVYFYSPGGTHQWNSYYSHQDGSNEIQIELQIDNDYARIATNHSSDGNNDQFIDSSRGLPGDAFVEVFAERHDGTGELNDDDHRITVTDVTNSNQVLQAQFNWPYLQSETGLRHYITGANDPCYLDYQHHLPLP